MYANSTVTKYRRPKVLPISLGGINLFLFLLSIWALMSPNPLEGILGLFTLFLILKLFWKPNIVFILPYCLLWHWLEIYTSVWEANYFGLTLNELFPNTGTETTWLAGFGLFSIMAGLYLSTNRKLPKLHKVHIQYAAQQIRLSPLIVLYAISFVLDIVITQVAFRFTAFSQLLIHFSNLKLLMYILIAYWVFVRRERYFLLFIVSGIEFASGLYSFFSDFKIVFIVLGITFVLVLQRLSFGRILLLSSLFSLAVISLFYWQIIKADYRKFVQQGSENMTVNTTFSSSLAKVRDLAFNVDKSDFEASIKAVFQRLGYLKYFSLTLERVPDIVPHENGKLLWDNINFAFIPRIINPNKGIKNDRAKVEKYAGIVFWTKGSFSLSYYSEAFVDFGKTGMMVFLFFLAFLIGKLFNTCMKLPYNLLLVYAITIVVLIPFASYGADAISLFGAIVWGAVSHLILFKPVYNFINRVIAKVS